jgi:hypothetical protein
MGGACSAHGGEERRIKGFGGGEQKGRDHLGEPGVDERIILRWIFRKWDVGVEDLMYTVSPLHKITR